MRTILALLILVALLPLATSIGISPPTADIEFVPEGVGSFDVYITNTRDYRIDTEVSMEGDLAKYFTMTAPSLTARGGGVAEVSFAFPEDITPGRHKMWITWTESYEELGGGSTPIRTAVKLRVIVWKPYPGQHADVTVTPIHVPEGSNTEVEVRVYSRGSEPLDGDLRIDVFGADGSLVDTDVMKDFFVPANTQVKRLVPLATATYPPGKYTVRARYDYGAAVASDERLLIIGTRTVDILNVSRVFYKDAHVNKFEVVVESLWNEPIDAVSASLLLGESTGRTPSITLAPFTQKTLTGYWEADESLDEGDHSALVTADYLNGTPVSKTFVVQVFNVTPLPEEEFPEEIVVLGVSDLLFFLLVFGIVCYFIFHSWRRHKKR